MSLMDTIASIEVERLHGVMQIWLWEFEKPENWPTRDSVLEAIVALRTRRDASDIRVQAAISECQNYLTETRQSNGEG